MKTQSKEFLLSAGQDWQDADEGIQRQVLGYNRQLMMVRINFEKGAVGTVHDHPHAQASYVASGRFKVMINGEEKVLNKGDGFFVPPNSPHGCECLEEGMLIDVFTPMREDFI